MSRKINCLQLSTLLSTIRQKFAEVFDKRDSNASALGFPLVDVLMAGLSMMFVQDPSLLEFQRRLQERRRSSNLRTIFKVEDVPKESQFRRILDPIDPARIQRGFKPCINQLQKTRLWHGYRVLEGRYAVLIDGSEFFRSQKCGCDNCLEFHHKDGRIDYAHQVLVATLAHPTAKRLIPLLLEEISSSLLPIAYSNRFRNILELATRCGKISGYFSITLSGEVGRPFWSTYSIQRMKWAWTADRAGNENEKHPKPVPEFKWICAGKRTINFLKQE